MARYSIVGPFTYRTASSHFESYVAPQRHPSAQNILDTTDPRWDLPADWKPPVIGLRPMDAEAKAALDAVRAPYLGVQWPGIGVVPVDEPVWTP